MFVTEHVFVPGLHVQLFLSLVCLGWAPRGGRRLALRYSRLISLGKVLQHVLRREDCSELAGSLAGSAEAPALFTR